MAAVKTVAISKRTLELSAKTYSILGQHLLLNGSLNIPLPIRSTLGALLFTHTGSSNAEVVVYLIPKQRPDSTKSTYKVFVKTVVADTNEEFRVTDCDINLSDYTLEVQTDANGAGQIMLTVIGRS